MAQESERGAEGLGKKTTEDDMNGFDQLTLWTENAHMTVAGLALCLSRAAAKDPYATPADTPTFATIRRWLAGQSRPNRSNRRLLALASSGVLRRDGTISGGQVPVEAWER